MRPTRGAVALSSIGCTVKYPVVVGFVISDLLEVSHCQNLYAYRSVKYIGYSRVSSDTSRTGIVIRVGGGGVRDLLYVLYLSFMNITGPPILSHLHPTRRETTA
jgi:hypothetical protein